MTTNHHRHAADKYEGPRSEVSESPTFRSTLESFNPVSFEELLADDVDVAALRATSSPAFEAAADFWRAPMESPHLTPRVKELVLLAMHASVTTYNVAAVERHIRRAQAVGASDEDIIDVLLTIVALANHALYFSVPILLEELDATEIEYPQPPTLDAAYERAKEAFIAARGFWNPDRDDIARLMPHYYTALDAVGTTSWNHGSLSPKEREFICIGIDCTVTHNYEPGLRRHIRNALEHGATRDEILEVFQLSGLLGLESYVLGAQVLYGQPAHPMSKGK
jgi:alkylhydroperoxidase/carboxymuconolactone decarboxylase family protein YurZ